MHEAIADWKTAAISECKPVFLKTAKTIQMFNVFKMNVSSSMKS